MADLELTIQSLLYLKRQFREGSEEDQAIDDAIELLTVQQPRVMAAQDWENNPDLDCTGELPVWVEWREDRKRDISFECSDGWATMSIDEYVDLLAWGGRAWNKRPTDEQRKATTWQDN